MKSNSTKLAFALALFLFSGLALAHPCVPDNPYEEHEFALTVDTEAAEEVEATPLPVADQTEPVGAPALLYGVGKTMDDWNSLGMIAGFIALINLLMQALRFRPIDSLFRKYKKIWVKPYIAGGLGAFMAGLVAYQAGVGVFQAIVAGLMAGMSAVGVHESVVKRKADKRYK